MVPSECLIVVINQRHHSTARTSATVVLGLCKNIENKEDR